MLWLMLLPGSADWRLIRADHPCWKGEIRASFYWFHVVLGWQRKKRVSQCPTN